MHHMIGRRMRNSSLVWVVCVIVSLLVVYKLIGYLYFLMLSSHYKSYIPGSLEVVDTVFAGDQVGGYLEGCGIGIFRLSEEAAVKVSRDGVAFLNKSAIKHGGRSRREYSSWQETPFVLKGGGHFIFRRLSSEDAGGNICANVPEGVKEEILMAAKQSKSFYSQINIHDELMVMPALRLVVFSHDR